MKKFILILRILRAVIDVLETEAERMERQKNDFMEGSNEDFHSSLRDNDWFKTKVM